ncbi:AlpA family phage regulatory protein [Salmonella enterica]|jgi:predicted DNA-binding transcriptional regulator AlpA|uniref:AlpA family phage regulatory protein n=1 Tax=Salmonella senftenberg TaxID=28150 RepID=A0A3V2HZ39_SALSE|nr:MULTISPECIES: AlpA family phage regulatory protein [Enterobacterales]ECC3098660.1 AlpA family phage regulatory protein [Salmonella enterica subsp. enterica]EDB5583811.1 AlpA family phage regulatory protein [Salmonella enterica subsp. enterica serovar Schwarzengrund]EDB5626172.1 AlpA family phage regulatory protein [Salmonella enterica subsp. enterica serovar Kentucky]EDX5041761.1 AlpA family phage regulatory protein [Salmonella enterica subsp. enterica serovar Westhampton]EDX7478301.1 AlpA 
MSTTFIPPTPEERLKILRDYGEQGDRLVRERERQRITSISRSTAWKLEQVGKFPQRKSIGLKSCGWLLSDLLCWINDR